jgi:hypothetical protein
MSPFRRPHPVIRRLAGHYERGIWLNDDEQLPITVQMGIQPATAGDYERLQSTPGGRRFAALLRAYVDLDAPTLMPAGESEAELPGDLVLYQGHRWLVIGRHTRDQLGTRGVSHIRYLLARQIEAGFEEVTV